jgi:MioC protein
MALDVALIPKHHDYTRREWGHDFVVLEEFDFGKRLRLSGWGSGIKAGDFLVLPNGEKTTRYLVGSIEYRSNPSDMWFADATFAPRNSASAEEGDSR